MESSCRNIKNMETQNLACVTGGCRCFKITMPEKVSNLKNADRCRPGSELSRHCFADLNFDFFQWLC